MHLTLRYAHDDDGETKAATERIGAAIEQDSDDGEISSIDKLCGPKAVTD